MKEGSPTSEHSQINDSETSLLLIFISSKAATKQNSVPNTRNIQYSRVQLTKKDNIYTNEQVTHFLHTHHADEQHDGSGDAGREEAGDLVDCRDGGVVRCKWSLIFQVD